MLSATMLFRCFRTLPAAVLLVLLACDQRADDTPQPDGAAVPKAPAAASAAAEEAVYAISLRPAGRYAIGQPAKVEAVLEAKGKYKCNPDYPYKFKLDEPPAGLRYPEPIAKSIERQDERSVLSIPFVPESAGDKEIRGTFYFSVCDKDICKIDKKPMSITIAVEES